MKSIPLMIAALVAGSTASAMTSVSSRPQDGADWLAPIACVVQTKTLHRTEPDRAFFAATEHIMEVSFDSYEANGSMELDRYQIQVRLFQTNSYIMRVVNLETATSVSSTVNVPATSTQKAEIELSKEYPPSEGGLRVLYPQYSLKLKCQLRSQSAPDIPSQPGGRP